MKDKLSDNFLKYLKGMRDYCLEFNDKSDKEKLDLFIHAMLVGFDGEAGDFSPHKIIPMYSSEDGNEWLDSGIDIAGSLHDEWGNFK